MQSKAATVAQYLAELPDDRRKAIEAVRAVFRKNLDRKLEEGMQYGMIGYYIPHSIYPNGYHCDPKQPLPFASIASQKNAMSLYLMCLYMDPAQTRWFVDAWKKTGKKLDMGKSCIRFKKVEDLALDVIGEAIKRVPAADYIRRYEANLNQSARAPSSTAKRKPATKKPAAKKASTKKASVKKKSTPARRKSV